MRAGRGAEAAPRLGVLELKPAPIKLRAEARHRRVADFVRLAIALVLVANLGRIPLLFVGNKDAPILATDVGVMAAVAIGGYVALRGRSLKLDGVAVAALLFAGVGALSALLAIPRFGLSGFQFLISIAYLVRWLVYFGLYLVVINFVRRSDVPALWGAFETMVLVFASFGIFQSLFLPGFAQMVYPDSELFLDWDPQGHRLVSTFLDPNFAGALIMLALLVLLSWIALGEEVQGWKVILLLTALAMTVSRSAVIGMMVGGMVILTVRGLSKRLLKGAAIALLLALPFVPVLVRFAAEYGKLSVGPSAIARVIMWARALEIFFDNPLLGVGFNTYGFVQEAYGYAAEGRASYTLDGGLLFVAVMTGVVGLTIYLGMIAGVLRRCRAVWRDAARTAHDRGLALGVAAATLGLIAHSVFLNSLFLPFLIGPLWVLWGLVFLVRQEPGGGEIGERGVPGVPTLVMLPAAGGS